MAEIEIGIIGGSGLYNMAGLSAVEQVNVQTPFGAPSDVVTLGTYHGERIAFLPRHGQGHTLMPGRVPYQANIYALKSLGVQYIVAISACGSLQEAYAPGHIVVPDQLFDHTKNRTSTFFGDGLVAHVGVADPFSPALSKAVADAVRAAGGTVHEGGAFITIEGPRFSTKGESRTYRGWGMDIIGMTTSPEAFLAREAEIAYAVMAHVTDYDVWHESEQPVTVEAVIRVLQANTRLAQAAIRHLVEQKSSWSGDFPAHHALRDALITDRNRIPAGIHSRLSLLVDKYLGD